MFSKLMWTKILKTKSVAEKKTNGRNIERGRRSTRLSSIQFWSPERDHVCWELWHNSADGSDSFRTVTRATQAMWLPQSFRMKQKRAWTMMHVHALVESHGHFCYSNKRGIVRWRVVSHCYSEVFRDAKLLCRNIKASCSVTVETNFSCYCYSNILYGIIFNDWPLQIR